MFDTHPIPAGAAMLKAMLLGFLIGFGAMGAALGALPLAAVAEPVRQP